MVSLKNLVKIYDGEFHVECVKLADKGLETGC